VTTASLDLRSELACEIRTRHRFAFALKADAEPASVALHQQAIDADVRHLVKDAFERGVMEDRIPLETVRVAAHVEPVAAARLPEPHTTAVRVRIEATDDAGGTHEFVEEFEHGRWMRRLPEMVRQLREEGTLDEHASVHRALLAFADDAARLEPLPLHVPVVEEGTLVPFGIDRLREGSFTPHRPILVNGRTHDEMLERTEAIGTEREHGAVVLGKHVRLPEPLPQSETRIVTILSTHVDHASIRGSATEVLFSPEALVSALPFAEARGLGEGVVTVVHSHLWGCGECNEKTEGCPLAEATHVSPQDYELLESLFPSRITPFPITGRIVGAEGRRPHLAMNVWRGGRMRSIRYRVYED
jgi:hypothetical protein